MQQSSLSSLARLRFCNLGFVVGLWTLNLGPCRLEVGDGPRMHALSVPLQPFNLSFLIPPFRRLGGLIECVDKTLQTHYSNPMRGFDIWLLGLCFTLVLGARAGEFPDAWTWDDDAKNRTAHAALEGKPMPALDLTGWVNGQVKPEDMKGKVVVVDLYATWCGPCIAAIPHNNEL